MADQLTAFASAQDRNAAQQRALLGAIAESGTAGAQAYQAQQAQQQQLQQAALKAASQAPSEKLAGTNALNSGALNDAQGTFERDIARQGSANSDYMAQVGAAIPIVESRTRMGVEQLIAEQQRRREQDALQLEQSRLSLQGQREQIAGQREARSAAAAERAAAEAGQYRDVTIGRKTLSVKMDDGLTPYQREQLSAGQADDQRRTDEDSRTRADENKAAYLDNLNRSTGSVDDKGKVVKSTNAYQAIYNVVNGFMTLDEALARFKTPAGKPLNRQYVEGEISRINGIK